MKKIIKINGMMCEKCEKKVHDALFGLGIESKVSHDNNEAIIDNTDITDEIIKETIENLGFEVKEIING